MAQPTEIPELAAELYDMSKEYLRQETIEPMKRLGGYAGFGLAGAAAFAVAAILAILGVYALMQFLLPTEDSDWYNVLARGITTGVAGIGAALVGWRMTGE